jgi:hypothetical protein
MPLTKKLVAEISSLTNSIMVPAAEYEYLKKNQKQRRKRKSGSERRKRKLIKLNATTTSVADPEDGLLIVLKLVLLMVRPKNRTMKMQMLKNLMRNLKVMLLTTRIVMIRQIFWLQ